MTDHLLPTDDGGDPPPPNDNPTPPDEGNEPTSIEQMDFDNPDDLWNHYMAQRHDREQNDQPPPEEGGDPPPDDEEGDDDLPPEDDEEGDDTEYTGEGYDDLPEGLRPFAEKFAAEGSFSEEDYAAMEEMGYTRALVDGYAEGQRAIAERMVGELHEITGGQANFAKMQAWTKEALTVEERKAFNKVANSGNLEDTKAALRGLWARYQQAHPRRARRTAGNRPAPNAGLTPFANQDEMLAAMDNPKYGTDEAYTKQVEARVGVSNF